MASSSGTSETVVNSLELLLQSGVKLEAKPITVATAACIYHKFVESVDTQNYDLILVSATCMYLAGKVEEDHLKPRDIINVYHNMLFKQTEPMDLSEHYWSLRDSLVHCELLILRLLKFKVHFDHPHKYLLHYWQSLSNWLQNDDFKHVPILRTCWALLSDFYMHSSCLRYQPQHVAIAILDLSLRCYGVQVPYNDDAVISWQEALCETAGKEELWKIIEDIIDSYDSSDVV